MGGVQGRAREVGGAARLLACRSPVVGAGARVGKDEDSGGTSRLRLGEGGVEGRRWKASGEAATGRRRRWRRRRRGKDECEYEEEDECERERGEEPLHALSIYLCPFLFLASFILACPGEH